MTFIASVIAKKGVALIADSLVTSSLPILHYNKFLQHLKSQTANPPGNVSINPSEIESLFAYEPIYTKDYEEKLFRLNKYTAITTTGIAVINDKKIMQIVHDFILSKNDIENLTVSIEDRIAQFNSFVTAEIKSHLGKYGQIGECIFMFSFFDPLSSQTHIYKSTIQETDKNSLDVSAFIYLKTLKEPDWVKVVCEGQNKLSDKILYGMGKFLYQIFPEFVNNIINRLQLPDGTVQADFITKLMQDTYFTGILYSDVELLNLTALSLQQAVDLTSLLMRLEVDFQKYTRDVPTVGGLIKLAVIDETGFRFISGDEILPPKYIAI